MEHHWSIASSGQNGAAGEGFSIGDSSKITQILDHNTEDDFECTYFRQRTNRVPTKEKKVGGLFPMTICYTLPSELSDGYTDSDSESDNTSNVERWLASLPENDAWSSAPYYSILDGSAGIEGVDEIQEDGNQTSENYSRTNDSRRSADLETGSTEIRLTGSDLEKRMSTGQDESSVLAERLDRYAPHEKMKRTLKTRQKIPIRNKVKRTEAETVIEKSELLEEDDNGGNGPCSLCSESHDIPERNITVNEKAIGKSNTLETAKSGMAIEKSSVEEDGYDEMIREMVNRLLTVSAYHEENSTSEQIVVNKSFTNIYVAEILDKESEEMIDETLARLGIKRPRLSPNSKKLSPELMRMKINEDKLLKRNSKAWNAKPQMQSTKLMRKIVREKKPFATKQKLKPIMITSESFVEKTNAVKKKSRSRTVRFQDEVTARNSSESWRQSAMVKAARNKQILQTVKQIVDDIQTEIPYRRKENTSVEPGQVIQKMSQNSITEQEPGDVVKLRKFGSWRSNRKRPMHSIENKIIGSKKPTFTNPFVEDCLDKAMDLALRKYKCPRNTWADYVTTYEPPAKKPKPKSFASKLENMQRPDFTLFNSWQSIHNYFLSYSSCE